MKVQLSAPARADILNHTAWLLERSPTAADAAMEAILASLFLLADLPRIGPALDDGTREKQVKFGRDGFIVRYEIDDDRMVVRRIFRGRQAR